MKPADISRSKEAAADARWRERAFVTQAAELGETGLTILRCRAPDVRFSYPLRNQSGRPIGKRLCGGRALAS